MSEASRTVQTPTVLPIFEIQSGHILDPRCLDGTYRNGYTDTPLYGTSVLEFIEKHRAELINKYEADQAKAAAQEEEESREEERLLATVPLAYDGADFMLKTLERKRRLAIARTTEALAAIEAINKAKAIKETSSKLSQQQLPSESESRSVESARIVKAVPLPEAPSPASACLIGQQNNNPQASNGSDTLREKMEEVRALRLNEKKVLAVLAALVSGDSSQQPPTAEEPEASTPDPDFAGEQPETPAGQYPDLPAEAALINRSIFLIPSTKTLVKAGAQRSLRFAEAHALRYVAAHTQIPVPKVLDAYEKDGVTYIFMERLPGEQLSKYIYSEEALPDDVLDKIVEQLRSYVSQLQALRGTYFGSIRENENEEGYTEDIHFKHHPVTVNEISRLFYGPYATRKEYNEGLIVALRNGRWMGELDEGDEELVERIHELDGDERKVFTHGDLHAGNILIDRDEGRVTGIVDFGESGWSVMGQDYFAARDRIDNYETRWAQVVERIFDAEAKANCELLEEINSSIKSDSII